MPRILSGGRTAIKNSIDTAARIKIKKYMYIALAFQTGTQDSPNPKIKKYMYIALPFNTGTQQDQ